MLAAAIVVLAAGSGEKSLAFSGTLHAFPRVGDDSLTCLACHDGVLAPNVRISHPIDIDYEAARRGRTTPLRPAASLPAAVRLVDGRVTCVTCHDLGSSLPGRLSIANARSALCLACHQL